MALSSMLLASERSERDTIRGAQIRAGAVRIYIYVWRYVCHISSACHVYVMWAELVHCYFIGERAKRARHSQG